MKRVLIFLLFLATAVSMAGAGPATEEKVVLTVWTDLSQDWNVDYIEAYRDLHPDVELDLTVMSDYHAQSRIALESGDKPDVWPTAVGTWLDQFIAGGGAMDITDIAEERGFHDVVAEPFWEFTTRMGESGGFPMVEYTYGKPCLPTRSSSKTTAFPIPRQWTS